MHVTLKCGISLRYTHTHTSRFQSIWSAICEMALSFSVFFNECRSLQTHHSIGLICGNWHMAHFDGVICAVVNLNKVTMLSHNKAHQIFTHHSKLRTFFSSLGWRFYHSSHERCVVLLIATKKLIDSTKCENSFTSNCVFIFKAKHHSTANNGNRVKG